ncbi:MAG: glycoside hydrolase family 13 protein, partial [Balneolales bacterium]
DDVNQQGEDLGGPPEWAKGVVWYHVFPERFRCGDSGNFPTAADQKGAWPHDYLSPFEPHPWGSDWYKKQPYELENEHDIWLNIQRRRYGGDLQGIIDKLDYLKDLGIGALYLNPVFDSPSHHKYDASSYHHVDPNFGPDPDGDRKLIRQENPGNPATWVWTKADLLLVRLIEKVHQREMKIILDGVFNHMGLTSWVYLDVVEKQQKSRFKDWLAIEQWDNFDKGKTFEVKTWEGYNELPEFRQDENGLVEGPRQYVYDITRRWMDPHGNGDLASGIDGWRLDVAYCIRHPFWKDWRKHCRSINPEAYLVAEVIDNIEEQKPYLQGDEFDAVMNYNFAFACTEFFIRDHNKLTPKQFDARLQKLREAYSPDTAHVMQNLLDSHDTDRVASRIVNRKMADLRDWHRYYHLSKGENPDYDTRKPTAEEYRTLKLLALFQMTYLGAPMIYYGSETGMYGGNDPCCRKPMIWPDISFEDDAVGPDLQPRPEPREISFDEDLHNYYRSLIHIRNAAKALQLGDYKTIIADNDNDIYAFSRNYKHESVMVVINNSTSKKKVPLQIGEKKIGKDLVSGKTVKTEEGKTFVIMPGLSGNILEII